MIISNSMTAAVIPIFDITAAVLFLLYYPVLFLYLILNSCNCHNIIILPCE